MTESRFNKLFNSFILVGMAVALVATTAIKMKGTTSDDGVAMLVVSAIGALAGILSTVCAANGKILTFLFGFIDVTIYGTMCFIGENYGNAALHVLYFIPMQIIGFSQWRKRGAAKEKGKLKARRLSAKQWAIALSVLIAGTAASYFVLNSVADESALKIVILTDALAVMCNILGQFLMSTAYADQWFFWIGVNVSTIIMWSAGLKGNGGTENFAAIYIIKYSFYLLNAFNGLRMWLKMSREASATEPQAD